MAVHIKSAKADQHSTDGASDDGPTQEEWCQWLNELKPTDCDENPDTSPNGC